MTDRTAEHPFLRGPEVADRLARLLQVVSAGASEIEAAIAAEAREARDDDTAERLGTLLARWSATAGAYEQASMGLQLWSAAAAPGPAAEGSAVPTDTAALTRSALERLESPSITPRVMGVSADAVAAAPLLDASSGSAGPIETSVPADDHVITLRAAGPYPAHLQDDVHRLATEYVSQSRGAVSIGTARAGAVPVTVTVAARPPGDDGTDARRWDHVTEASIMAPEGLVVLSGRVTPVLRLRLPIGVWRLRTYAENLRSPGRDVYHLILWRDRSLPDAVVVTQFRE